MMSEVRKLITITKGFGTRYLQGYLDFMLMIKKMGYRYKREEVVNKIYEAVEHIKVFTIAKILQTPMPVSLKEAYYEYHYGIFE